MMERLKESRWLYILVSVLIAVAFWLYIRNVQNTASDYTIYNVPVQITNSRVLNERGLTVASLSQDTVNVTVNAPWSVQRNLNRNNIVSHGGLCPPLRRRAPMSWPVRPGCPPTWTPRTHTFPPTRRPRPSPSQWTP